MDIVECMIRAGQNGYASEIAPFHSLNREVWGEEQLWDAIKDYQHLPQLRTSLMYNAKVGNMERIKFLLKRGANVNLMDKEGRNALMWAVLGGQIEAFNFLYPLTTMKRTIKNECLLHIACQSNNVDILRHIYYLYEESQINERSTDKCEIPIMYTTNLDCIKFMLSIDPDQLHFLSLDGGLLHKNIDNDEIVDYLINKGIYVDTNNAFIETPLRAASDIGNIRVMEKLIDAGANIDSLDYINYTCLMNCIDNENVEAVKLLLDCGAYLLNFDNDGNSLIHIAVSTGNYEITRILIEHGARINDLNNEGKSALFYCLNFLNVMHLLISKGIDINAKDNTNSSVLIEACKYKNFYAAKLLLSNPYLNLNDQEQLNGGYSALHYAIYDANLVKLFMDHKNLLELQTYSHYTPLLLCCKMGYLDSARILILNGSNLHAKTIGGHSCIEIASKYGHYKIVQLLLKYDELKDDFLKGMLMACHSGQEKCLEEYLNFGMDVNEKVKDDTCLFVACWKGHVKIVDMLLKRGAKQMSSNDGSTCMDVAKEGEKWEICDLLLKSV